MAETLLLQSAERLLAKACTDDVLKQAEAGQWPASLWDAVEEFGLSLALVDDGISLSDALALVRLAGELAIPLPVPETMIANLLLSRAGLAPFTGPATVICGAGLHLGATRLMGTVGRVPWGRSAAIAAVAERDGRLHVVRLGRDGVTCSPGANIAHEPRDGVTLDVAAPEHAVLPLGMHPLPLLAAARCNQMAGAMSRIAEMSIAYVLQREQFGRPLAKFQAVQQNLAVMTSNVAAAQAAADLAAEAAEALPVRTLAIAAAKVRIGEAAGAVAAIAHQAHGAMGFTHEYRLHHLTRRLWSWRDECGNEAYWSAELGRAMARAGPDGLWPALTAV